MAWLALPIPMCGEKAGSKCKHLNLSNSDMLGNIKVYPNFIFLVS